MHWNYCDTASFSAEEIRRLYERLSPSRKTYIDSLHREKDKLRSLTAEFLIYRILQEHYDLHGCKLHRRENGEPYLTGCSLSVSISHCGEKIACAVSREPVGIDLERIRPVDLKLCRHVCTAEEKAYVLGDYPENLGEECGDPDVLRRFFEIWTAKEAYFKKRGTGITGLKSVNVLPLPRKIFMVEDYMVQML